MIYALINPERLRELKFGFDAIYYNVKTSGFFRRIVLQHARQAKQLNRTITFQCNFNDGSKMIAKCYTDGGIRMNVGQPYETYIANYSRV